MDQVEEIKRKINIEQIVGEYVELKKSGRNYKGLCPFHGEKTPSFMVNEELGIFKCFGCGASGDVIKFLMDVDGLDFMEALERLAGRAGIKLVRKKGEDRSERMKLFDICSMAAQYYHFLLTSHAVGKKARQYLKERKLGEKLQETFNLGYALDGWDGVYSFLCRKKGFDEKLVEKAGLIIQGSRGYYDRFRDRIIFPFYDNVGRIVGFSGRVLPDYQGEGGKYINSPETAIYHKGEILFGLQQAKQFIREKKRLVLVEGQMDMISSYGAGMGETVASGGTAVTDDQMKIVSRLAETILVALDVDDAGYAAIKKTVGLAEKYGLSIKVVGIEGGKDPDDMARSNPKAWKTAVEKAMPVYEFVMQKALSKFGSKGAEAVAQVSREVLPFLVKIENKMVLGHWMKKLARVLDVDEGMVWEELEKYQKSGGTVQAPVVLNKPKKDRLEELGVRLVSLLFEANAEQLKEAQKILAGLRIGKPWAGAMKVIIEAGGEQRKEVGWVEKLIEKVQGEEAEVLREAYLSDLDRSDLKVEAIAGEFRRAWVIARKNVLVEEIKRLEKEGKKTEMNKLMEEFVHKSRYILD